MIFSNKKRLPTWRRRRTGPRRDTSTPTSPLYHFANIGKMEGTVAEFATVASRCVDHFRNLAKMVIFY